VDESTSSARAPRRSILERVIFFAALAFLLIVAGMLVARLNVFPYPIVDDAVTAARATAISMGWLKDVETGADTRDGERTDTRSGVTFHDASLAAGGYTAFTSGDDEAAYLIDMDGRIVHQWSLTSDDLRQRFGPEQVPDVELGWRSVHVYPNGDLVVVLQRRKYTPYGFALVKLDKDSNVIWANFGYTHHDVVVGEDGLLYSIGQAIREQAIPELPRLKTPFLEDFIHVVNSAGETVHRVSIMEAFVGTPFESAVHHLAPTRDWKGDYFHVNAVEPYDSRNPTAVIGKNQVLVSIRNMDSLATIDLGTGKVVWLLNGYWLRQHDPDIVNGRIMLFDNRGDYARGARSRVLEFDPLTLEITWQAAVGQGYDLYSGWGASQQVLENGNVLITESAPGRLLELTRDGRRAWEFFSAGRASEGSELAPAIQEARRYAPGYFRFPLRAN
jgi:hypothetical protein